jgi:hypothetical protein
MYYTVRHPNQKTSTVRRADQKGLPNENRPEGRLACVRRESLLQRGDTGVTHGWAQRGDVPLPFGDQLIQVDARVGWGQRFTKVA